MPERQFLLARLLGILKPQILAHSDVKIETMLENKEFSLGANRELLRQQADGEYINFVDDDDLVAKNYVEKIYPLLDGVDYIGFDVATYRNGVFEPTLRACHSLGHRGWGFTDKFYYRDISHMNPMRRELALKIPMEGDRGEDARWATAMRDSGLVKTEHYIPEVMYHYLM